MPCSPVTVPPMSIATSTISANAACDRLSAASSPSGVMSSGCRLPSPAWAALAMKVSWRAAISSTRTSISASRPRGRQTSSTRIGSPRCCSAEYTSRRAAKSASASAASVDMTASVAPAATNSAWIASAWACAPGSGTSVWASSSATASSRQPDVLPRVDRREAMAVDQLEHGGLQPALGHPGDGRAAGGKGVEEPDDGTGGGRAGRAQPHGHLRDHTQRALGADHAARPGRSPPRPSRCGARGARPPRPP